MQARSHGETGLDVVFTTNSDGTMGNMPCKFWLVSCLTFVSLVAGCSRRPETPTGPSPSPDTINYIAIGASDAVGVGSSVICLDPVNCPNGTSYVWVLQRALRNTGKTVNVSNLGVPGVVMSPAIQALTRQIGRTDVIANMIENQVIFVTASTTHITIFAGGNDANAIAQAIRANVPGSDTPNDRRAFIDRQVAQWGTDLEDLIRRIRARSANARIVAYNLPNLAALGYVAGLSTTEKSILQRIAVGVTDRINALAGQNVLIVDLMCEPRIYSSANVSSDGFHPSDAGYQLMADLAFNPMANGTASAPNPGCAQRTIFPAF